MADQNPYNTLTAEDFATDKPNISGPPESRIDKQQTRSKYNTLTAGDFTKTLTTVRATPPAAPQSEPWYSRSIPKMIFGGDLEDLYDNFVGHLNSKYPDQEPGYWTKFAQRVIRKAPEAVDFLMSPIGIPLTVGHAFPQTRPFAVAADRLLGGYQVVKTGPAILGAIKDPSDPEKVADAATDMVMSFGILKGAAKMARGGNKLFAPVAKDRKISADQFFDVLKNAPVDQKLKVLNDTIKPQTRGEALSKKLYESPITRQVAMILDIPKPKHVAALASLVEDRNIIVEYERLRAAEFVDRFKRTVPKEDRDIRKIGYVLEKTHTPEQVGLGKEATEFVNELRAWNKHSYKFLEDSYKETYGKDYKVHLHDPETYVMHKIGFTDDIETTNNHTTEERARFAASVGASRRMLYDPQLRPRIPGSTWQYLIEERGFEPISYDVADLIMARHNIAATTVANQRFANVLRDAGLIVSEKMAQPGKDKATGKRTPTGYELWPTADARSLERAVFAGRTNEDEAILRKMPVRVHPAVKPAVDAIFAEGFRLRDPKTGTMTVPGALEWFRSFGKQNAVGVSFFHHWSISEQTHAAFVGAEGAGLKGLGKAIKGTFLFNPDFYRGIKTGLWEVREKANGYRPPVLGLKHAEALDAVKHGLTMGTADMEGAIVKSLRTSNWRAMRWLGNLHYINNRALWDFYLPSQMLNSYETIFNKEMSLRPRNTPEEITELKREVARHVNKVFGTEGLNQLFMHPKTRFLLNFALFAPVWTFSNFRVLSNGFQTETAAKLVGRWMAGAMFAWFATSNLMNYATTSWLFSGQQGPAPDKDGNRVGHFMWDNPGAPTNVWGRYIPGVTENSTNIFFGYSPNGQMSFIRFGNAYRDPFKFFIDPQDYLVSKLGLLPKFAVSWITGYEPGSDFQLLNPSASFEERVMERAAMAAETVSPFMAQDIERSIERVMFPEVVPETGLSQAGIPTGVTIPGINLPVRIPLGLPVRSGLTLRRAVQALYMARQAGREDLAEQVLDTAAQNNISTKSVENGYKDIIRRRGYTAHPKHAFYNPSGEIVQPPETR
jgi:hypothetical protein